MKPELIHLLAKLKSDHPDFQNLILHANGVAMACLQHGYRRFESLDALEQYAWPAQEVGTVPARQGPPRGPLEKVGTVAPRGPLEKVGTVAPRGPLLNLVAPSAQDKV